MVKKAIVTVNEGKVCGIKTTSSFSGTEYYAFYGIPYGQSTSNMARFKDPVKVKPWKNVYDATTQKEGCSQFSLRRQNFSGSEDCLYNNVYTPELPSKDDTLKSVVVCIHPGGYFHGSPDPWYYGAPDYVMNKDIVYVCVGYRLHILAYTRMRTGTRKIAKYVLYSREPVGTKYSLIVLSFFVLELFPRSCVLTYVLLKSRPCSRSRSRSSRKRGFLCFRVPVLVLFPHPWVKQVVKHGSNVWIFFKIYFRKKICDTRHRTTSRIQRYKSLPYSTFFERLGFLNLELEECSGNQGLKDIILSLKWIKENITAFGGDPSNVTLLGSSSASTLVQGLMISPAARGLFHKAVMMGIYIFDPTLARVEDQLPFAYKLARNIGYNGTNPKDKKNLLMFLKKAKIQEIIQSTYGKDQLKDVVSVYPTPLFVPMVDKGENAVLPLTPRELLATMPPIPLIFGICEKEAVMAFARPLYKYTMKNFNTAYLQNTWGWGWGLGKEEVDVISDRVRAFYCNGQPVEKASTNLQIDILTDIAFSDVYDTLIDVISADLPSSVFVYKFQFEGNACTMNDRLKDILQDRLQGTCHAADFSYWAYIVDHWGVKNDTLNAKSAATVEIFTNLITTFAKTGDPNYDGLNVVWKPTTPENPCYLSIDDTLQLVDGKLNGKRMEFWENIKKEFRKS